MADTALQPVNPTDNPWAHPLANWEPPVCEQAMRRWRDRQVRIQRAEAGGALNYWERPETGWQYQTRITRVMREARKRRERKERRRLKPKVSVGWFVVVCAVIVGLIVAGEIVGFHWGRLSVLALRIWLKSEE